MDEVTISEVETPEVTTRVTLRPAVAIALGVVLGIAVGVAISAALTSVATTYAEPEEPTTSQVLIEDDEPTLEGTFEVTEE